MKSLSFAPFSTVLRWLYFMTFCRCPYGYMGSYCEMGKLKGAPAGTGTGIILLWTFNPHSCFSGCFASDGHCPSMTLAAPELISPAAANQPGGRIYKKPVLFRQRARVSPDCQHHQLAVKVVGRLCVLCELQKMFEQGLDRVNMSIEHE